MSKTCLSNMFKWYTILQVFSRVMIIKFDYLYMSLQPLRVCIHMPLLQIIVYFSMKFCLFGSCGTRQWVSKKVCSILRDNYYLNTCIGSHSLCINIPKCWGLKYIVLNWLEVGKIPGIKVKTKSLLVRDWIKSISKTTRM